MWFVQRQFGFEKTNNNKHSRVSSADQHQTSVKRAKRVAKNNENKKTSGFGDNDNEYDHSRTPG